ncbi:unnamed protein product [Lasius platythorax]
MGTYTKYVSFNANQRSQQCCHQRRITRAAHGSSAGNAPNFTNGLSKFLRNLCGVMRGMTKHQDETSLTYTSKITEIILRHES